MPVHKVIDTETDWLCVGGVIEYMDLVCLNICSTSIFLETIDASFILGELESLIILIQCSLTTVITYCGSFSFLFFFCITSLQMFFEFIEFCQCISGLRNFAS